jgi:molybdenum cofactor cytidylyltransferase
MTLTRPEGDGMSSVAAIVLAAGQSSRMGTANKMLADIGGKPMLRRVVETALASRARPVLVIVGHEADEVRAALNGLDIMIVANPDYALGMSTSLAAGIRAVPPTCAGALVLLGDMPEVAAEHLDRLISAFTAAGPSTIIVPTHEGKRGNPLLWPAAYFSEILQLQGDVGARSLLAAHAAHVREVDLGTAAIFADVDTPEALEVLRRGHQG